MLEEYTHYSDINFIRCQLELVNDFTEETNNIKNKRGRKLCPINFTELRVDNTIKLGNILYSTSGLMDLVKKQTWYNEVISNKKNNSFNIYLLTTIKNPITNINFTRDEACTICLLLLKKYPIVSFIPFI
jgi:hypothetical protein